MKWRWVRRLTTSKGASSVLQKRHKDPFRYLAVIKRLELRFNEARDDKDMTRLEYVMKRMRQVRDIQIRAQGA